MGVRRAGTLEAVERVSEALEAVHDIGLRLGRDAEAEPAHGRIHERVRREHHHLGRGARAKAVWRPC